VPFRVDGVADRWYAAAVSTSNLPASPYSAIGSRWTPPSPAPPRRRRTPT